MFIIHDKAQCYITTKISETEKKKTKNNIKQHNL